jgi:hypothetical protein
MGKAMNRKRLALIGLIATGVLILAWIPLAMFSGSETKTDAAVTDDRHCPICGRELSRSGGECIYCKIEGKGDLSKKAMQRGSLFNHPIVPTVLFSTFGLLAAANLFVFLRRRVVASREEESYYISCPKCHRRLRFRKSQMGRLGMCPLCKRPLLFPKLDAGPRNPLIRLRRRLVHWVSLSRG